MAMPSLPTRMGSVTTAQSDAAFARFAGRSAILAALAVFLYSVAFIVIARSSPGLAGLLSALFLLLTGVFATAPLLAVYNRLRETDASFALLALLFGLVGAFGSLIHGGYDLANAINPPSTVNLDLPSQVDPRGLLTFGIAALGLYLASWLIERGRQFPAGLGYLGYVGATLSLLLYLGRLIILSAASPIIVVPALLAGFLVTPIWYLWVGIELGKTSVADE